MKEVELDYGTVVYHLLKDDEVVYVGNSTNLISRLAIHTNSDKDFDSCQIRSVEYEDRTKEEAIDILKHEPKYNLGLPSQERFVSYQMLKHMLLELDDNKDFKKEVHATRLKRYVKELGIPTHKFAGCVYIDINTNLSHLYKYIKNQM